MTRTLPSFALPSLLLSLLVSAPAAAELRIVLVDSLALPPGEVTGLTWAGRDTLAVLTVQTDSLALGSTPRVLLTVGRPAAEIYWQAEFTGVLSRGLAWDGEHFWSCGDDLEGGSLLYKIRADTVDVVASYPTPGHRPTALVHDGRWLWLTDRDLGRIDRIDPETGQLTRSVGAPGFSPGGLAWDGRHHWVSDAGTGLLNRMRGARLEHRDTVAADDWFQRGDDALLVHDGRDLWILPAESSHLRRILLE